MTNDVIASDIPRDVFTWLEQLTQKIAEDNEANGFWDEAGNPLVIPTKLALIHSEISEALEGHRKQYQDEHLPQYASFEVELADAVIRILDICGHEGINLLPIIMEKLRYNRQRQDHKPAERYGTEHGKKY